MRDITTELKELRLHGMAGAWDDLTTQEGGANRCGHTNLAVADRAFAASRTCTAGLCLSAPPDESG